MGQSMRVEPIEAPSQSNGLEYKNGGIHLNGVSVWDLTLFSRNFFEQYFYDFGFTVPPNDTITPVID